MFPINEMVGIHIVHQSSIHEDIGGYALCATDVLTPFILV